MAVLVKSDKLHVEIIDVIGKNANLFKKLYPIS